MVNPDQTPQAQEVQSQMPSINNDSSKSKVIPIILGVAAVVVIAIGAYLLGTKQSQPVVQAPIQTTPIPSPIPTVDETANWKTYTDSKYNYSLKYPFSWNLKPTPSREISINSPDSNMDTNGSNKKGALLIVWPNNNPPITSSDFSVDSERKIELNGLDAIFYEVSGAGIEGSSDTVAIKKDSAYFTLDYHYEQSRKTELEKIFDQILATFKFTE